ncbi:MAG: ADP-heptose--LPS heptosyltransferase II [Gemmatimonadales bacterium]|nr:MAG: ADP-heptose--LPS heptosyltransferase II [Gemmatimonadales bacterium]
MSRALVIQTAWLGDVILTSPLLQKAAAVHDRVDVVTTPAAKPLVETHPAVDRVFTFDKRGTQKGARGLIRAARQLRLNGYDTAYLPHRSVRSALLAWLARIPERIGFGDTAARWLYTETKQREGASEIERLARLVPGPDTPPLRIWLAEADRLAATRELEAAGIEDPFVVIAPGSARATKRWPYFRELAMTLASRIAVVAVGETSDRLFHRTQPRTTFPLADLCGRLTIRESAAVIERAAVAVVNDSAPMHLAAALGTPVVAVFGPTHPCLGFAPQGEEHRFVQLDLPCRPCSLHGGDRCPLGHHRCMRDLSVEDVLSAVEAALEIALQEERTP